MTSPQTPAVTAGPANPPANAAAADPKKVDERLKVLSEELRCLVCQNQTLADSNAELAVDLRNQVKLLIEQGRSDEQIKTWLVDRYGDFVLYKPPMQSTTWLLWFGPFLLLLLGVVVWRRVQRKGASNAASAPTTAASQAQIDAARKLLDS